MAKQLNVKVNINAYSAGEILQIYNHLYLDHETSLCVLVLQKFKEKLQLIEINGRRMKLIKLSNTEALGFWIFCTRNKITKLNPFVFEIFELVDKQLNKLKQS